MDKNYGNCIGIAEPRGELQRGEAFYFLNLSIKEMLMILNKLLNLLQKPWNIMDQWQRLFLRLKLLRIHKLLIIFFVFIYLDKRLQDCIYYLWWLTQGLRYLP